MQPEHPTQQQQPQQCCSDFPTQLLLACGPWCSQPAQVEASFSTLLDDEDEFEYEEGDEAELIEDDIDETLLVDNLGLSEEVCIQDGVHPACLEAPGCIPTDRCCFWAEQKLVGAQRVFRLAPRHHLLLLLLLLRWCAGGACPEAPWHPVPVPHPDHGPATSHGGQGPHSPRQDRQRQDTCLCPASG